MTGVEGEPEGHGHDRRRAGDPVGDDPAAHVDDGARDQDEHEHAAQHAERRRALDEGDPCRQRHGRDRDRCRQPVADRGVRLGKGHLHGCSAKTRHS